MDALAFDGYTDYSDSSTPRTPSPQEYHQYQHPKDQVNMVFPDGGLLQELYDHDSPYSPDWQYQQQHQQPHPQAQRPHDYTMVRRATFPYVRQDAGLPPPPQAPQFNNGGYYYEDPNVKLEDPNAAFYRHHHHQLPPYMQPPMPPQPYLSPHTGLPVQHTDDAASKETQYLRRRCFNCHTTEPPSWRRSTLNPGKIVCNKCGLYERTHLRPRPLRFDELRAGNKARKGSKGQLGGHQVGAGAPNGLSSPPLGGSMGSPKIKKEPGVPALHRRSSVSSNTSSSTGNSDWEDNVSIYSSASSNHSAPPTSFSSPAHGSFPLPMQRESLSPPGTSAGLNNGSSEIRLPNNPLAELQHQSSHPQLMMSAQQQQQNGSPNLLPQSPPLNAPRKSHSMPMPIPPRSSDGLVNSYPPSNPSGSPALGALGEVNEWTPSSVGSVGSGVLSASPHITATSLGMASPQQMGSPVGMEA